MASISASVITPGYEVTGWITNGAVLPGNIATLNIRILKPTTVKATFGPRDATSTAEWPTWLRDYGLSTNSTPGDGKNGDPDKDGLSNWVEFGLRNTNRSLTASPINADSDGDGMDDGYEYAMDSTNNVSGGVAMDFISAVVDNGGSGIPAVTMVGTIGLNIKNGPLGNPDEDFHWSTDSGYQMTAEPLQNIEEWRGPDGTNPVIYLTLDGSMPAYFTYTGFTFDHGNTVIVMVTNALDSLDQSKAGQVDTDNDKFDDGFEYSWDQWQKANGGFNEVWVIGVVNSNAVAITNTVPVWDGRLNATRVFNPRTPIAVSDSRPDGDVLYDYLTGGVSANSYSTLFEYNAWKGNAFSVAIGGAPHSIRRDFPPNADDLDPQRCSHPFLIDVDQDGLPDGYEVIFGYDPWSAVTPGAVVADGDANPDGDWMARADASPLALRNHEIYTANGFDPRTAVAQFYPVADDMPGPGLNGAPNTELYSNLDELRGADGLMRVTAGGVDDATSPINNDSDGDGMWDGWENYVDLNPNNKLDAGLDFDGDKLSDLAEFQSFLTSSTNGAALTPVAGWMNKLFPTDPGVDPSPIDTDTRGGADTDADGVVDGGDGGENSVFNGTSIGGTNVVFDLVKFVVVTQVFTVGTWVKPCYVGGGLNPTSSDTDEDTLPDPYEASYKGGLDGTESDTFGDPDNDRLPNYLEYYSASVYHFQYDAWADGLPFYDSGDFFQGTPKAWDWYAGPKNVYIPMFPMGLSDPGRFAYAGANPVLSDADEDGMDDYYEIYHGLNPGYGLIDLISSRDLAAPILVDGIFLPYVADPRSLPYVNGSSLMDSDGDGLPNTTESVNLVNPERAPQYHTDPTPLWITDMYYPRSWVNLYYVPGSIWPWSGLFPPPVYAFDFESNEGYDTDNDGFSDYEELNTIQTDPLSPEHPIKRRALYLPDGLNAYARTFPAFPIIAREELRSFTVEAWVRPLNPASGLNQVVVERPMMLPIGNPMNLAPGVRVNFRLGVDAAGYPYVGYTGDGSQPIYNEAKATGTSLLRAGEWAHLCGTYQVASATDPSVRGKLTLYINGQIAKQTSPNELPAIGRFGNGLTVTEFASPILVGAADNNPDGDLSGASPGSLANQPDPTDFFKGWIDEVRIWDGARTQVQVTDTMKARLKQADVVASWSTAVPLMYLYSFDALPDPDHSSTASPVGFDVTASAIFPFDWPNAFFWGTEPAHSLPYSDYRYVPWIENAVAHAFSVPPSDMGDSTGTTSVTNGTNVTFSVPFANTTDPYGDSYFTAVALGLDVFEIFNDLLPLEWAVADEDVPMWDNNTIPALVVYDSDGDGLPDSWEEAHGLDPLDATGDNGPNGDLDGDGLNNLAEYTAGTDPQSFDTDGNGVGDYDSISGSGNTYGVIYDDGDGMSDLWEELYPDACSPLVYDANLDPDKDGWDNFSEYMGRTDPSDMASYPIPSITFTVRYEGTYRDGNLMVLGYDNPAMDGEPEVVYKPAGGGLMGVLGESLGLTGAVMMNGTLGSQPVLAGSLMISAGTVSFADNGNGQLVGTLPGNSGTIDYNTGAWTLTFQNPPVGNPITANYAFIDNTTVTYPGKVAVTVPDFGHLRQGPFWFHAFLDLNNDSTWQEGEPFGLGQGQPISMSWGSAEVELGLTDKLPGYQRFSWLPVAGKGSYDVQIRRVNSTGQPLVFERTVQAVDGLPLEGTRTYIHEGDIMYAGYFGLPSAGLTKPIFQWFVDGVAGGQYTNSWALSLAAPQPVAPVGGEFVYAQNQLEWTTDDTNTQFRVYLGPYNNGGAPATYLVNKTIGSPYRDGQGHYRYTLPIYAGDRSFTNAVYSWQIQAINPTASSVLSPTWTQFRLNVRDTTRGTYSISGTTYYYGSLLGLGATHYEPGGVTHVVVVQAFASSGFSGTPVAQMTYAGTGTFTLLGLPGGTYYLRAFIDQDGDRELDSYESWGMVKDSGSPYSPDYLPGSITIPPVATLKLIAIRDRDTDQDHLVDGIEMHNSGTLTTSGPGPIPGSPAYTDLDHDGLNDYDEQAAGSDWRNPDTDGDGLSDGDEFLRYGSDATSKDSDGDGLQDGYEVANGLSPATQYDDNSGVPSGIKLLWDGGADYNPATDLVLGEDDSDGDGTRDLMEIAAGTDPLNRNSKGEIAIKSVTLDSSGRPIVEWDTYANSKQLKVQYDLEYTEDLVRWQVVGSWISQGTSNAPATVVDTTGHTATKKGFYRLRLDLVTP